MSWHTYIVASASLPPVAEIYVDGTFQPNNWSLLGDDDEIPAGGQVFVSLKRWKSLRDGLVGTNHAVGVILRAGEDVADLAADAAHLPAIALDFPKYGDGRAYSYATLLRTRYGFTGELRAVGDVLLDQIGAMRRVGFTSFEIRNPHTRAAIEAGVDPEVKEYYQPSVRVEIPAGTRPWQRRG